MSVGNRLREERLRLKASQASFASVAGVSKNTAINWEKETSSPTASALIALAEIGVDLLYVLTGRRILSDPDTAVRSIEDDLAEIRRDILDPRRDIKPGDDAHAYERDKISDVADLLRTYLQYDADLMTPEQLEESRGLLAIVSNPAQLAAYRAADFAHNRLRRDKMKETLSGYFDKREPDGEYGAPAGPALNILVTLALDYAAPVNLLVELVYELRADSATRPAYTGK